MIMVALPATFPEKNSRVFIMQISGEWLLCDDRVERPVIRGEVEAADGSWVPADFLLDPGADRTVFSADIFNQLHLESSGTPDQLAGLGGIATSIVIATQIRLTSEAAGKVLFRGQFSAVTDPATLDMSVLGRDISNLFSVIIDHPGKVVCLLAQRHRYRIEES